MKIQDIKLVAAILLCACAVFLGSSYGSRRVPEEVVVYAEDEEILRFPLQKNRDYLIVTETGAKNRLIIRNGQAEITEASCRDKLCVNQKAISMTGEIIVCLPNRILVTVQEASGTHR